MFGIGLPEMILILALALIVVGPDKLPDLARSMAKGLMELKKTAEGLKQSFTEEGNPLDDIRPDLEEAAKNLKDNLLEQPPYQRQDKIIDIDSSVPEDNAAKAYQELMKQTDGQLNNNNDTIENTTQHSTSDNPEIEPDTETDTDVDTVANTDADTQKPDA